MSEDFSFLEEATPVKESNDDSVQSEVNQIEADELRTAANTDGADQRASPPSSTDSHPVTISQCRHCRKRFRTQSEIEEHLCSEEPLACCRYCSETHTSTNEVENHLYQCEKFRRARTKESRQNHSQNKEAEPLPGRFIDPAFHEFKAFVKYDCSDHCSPLQSYFGLNSLQKEHDFEEHGNLRAGLKGDFNGIKCNELNIEFSFKESGIAPKEDAKFSLQQVREYQIYLYPSGYENHKEAKKDGRQRAYFRISPRWPDIVSTSGISISNPYEITGYDVEFSGSNIPFEVYPELFHSAIEKLEDRQGFKWTDPTYIRPNDFAPGNIHKSSNIVDAELYVRVHKDYTQQVYAIDGSLHRISLLLSEDRSGYAKSIRDDRECPGFYHTATIGANRIEKMIPGHRWPREHKHYHVKHPKAVEGGPLEHPKIAVSLQSSLTTDTPKWSELDVLERELDEALLNILKWSDIRVRPDHQVFVADDYFEVSGTQRFRKLLHNKLPRIESMQENEVHKLAVAGNATKTDAELLDLLVTDGGEHSPASIAEKIGCALSTVYSSIDRLGDLVDHQYGDVRLTSQYIGQQIVRHLEAVKETINTDLETAVDKLVQAENFVDPSKNNPFSLWLQNWVEDIREHNDGPDEIILGFEPKDTEAARRILREGAGKWAQVTGNDKIDFADEYVPVVETQQGEVWSPSRWDFKRTMPGYRSRYHPV